VEEESQEGAGNQNASIGEGNCEGREDFEGGVVENTE